jgi:hypothetical protein
MSFWLIGLNCSGMCTMDVGAAVEHAAVCSS